MARGAQSKRLMAVVTSIPCLTFRCFDLHAHQETFDLTCCSRHSIDTKNAKKLISSNIIAY